MSTETAPSWGTRERAILAELFAERGLRKGDYALFFTSGDGELLPISEPGDEVEETSGYLLDRQGRAYWFHLGWDAERTRPALLHWDEVKTQPEWESSAEYREACKQIGVG